MRTPTIRRLLLSAVAVLATLAAGFMLGTAPASATTSHSKAHSARAAAAGLSGTTAVTTAPGIATTFLKAGILPLPARGTGFGIGFNHGLNVTYRFPITGGNPDLAAGTGDILHSGGINFVSYKAHLEVGKFDISLADGKVYATEVNYAPAKVALLDLDLSGLQVGTKNGATVLSGIKASLDGEAAGALNATFGLSLPTDGSLAFGTAVVTLKS